MANPAEYTQRVSYTPLSRPLLLFFVAVYLITLGASMCLPQEIKLPADDATATFGVTVVSSSGLKGDIYLLKENTSSLPNFKKLKPVGAIYTPSLHLTARNFNEGFPGITDRLFLRAGGADGAIARGEAPQRGSATPGKIEKPNQAPEGRQTEYLPPLRGLSVLCFLTLGLRFASPQAIAPTAPPARYLQ